MEATALLQRAQSEGRDVTEDEIAELRASNDEQSAMLIEKLEGRGE